MNLLYPLIISVINRKPLVFWCAFYGLKTNNFPVLCTFAKKMSLMMRYLIFLFLLITSLTSCVSSQTTMKNATNSGSRHTQNQNRYKIAQDKAPSGPVPKAFKTVTPKNEPLSRYGNPASYHVDGKNYAVMTSATGYKRQGLASWYGMKFHKERTSSGEPYNMYALTAAHKTLPIPTYIKVKNLENGKEAIVKVNDRGPFHSSRILDLSYGAAVKLGIFPRGTARIEIEALTPKGSSRTAAHYYIQAGAFTDMVRAKKLQQSISKLTTSPVRIENYPDNHVVRVGPFATRQMSEALKQRLVSNGVKGAFSVLG